MSSQTIRLMSANGKGFSSAAFTMLNSPVAAAIPTARETTAVAAKPGLRRKIRSAYRRSTARRSSKKFPQRRARKNITTPECSSEAAEGEHRGVATTLQRGPAAFEPRLLVAGGLQGETSGRR